MIIILGADGHVGSAVAKQLLYEKQEVMVVLHKPDKTEEWKQQGAMVSITDINDTEALRTLFSKGEKAFLLNPPAAPSSNTVTIENKSVQSILSALAGSGIKKVVAESTYGAQAGNGIGDLGVLYNMEKRLAEINIPAIIIRAAYYMSNWATALETAQKEGVVHTLYPVDFTLPMVAPNDVGQMAARFLMEPVETTGLHYVEGPKEYSSADVATAFSVALNKPIKAVETKPDQWKTALKEMGFSDVAADSMMAMTRITLGKKYETKAPERGETDLQQYVQSLVKKQ